MACNAPASRFMFVEYSKPVEPVKGQKRRRGGPSEVRAHITKNYHRALRVKRLEALKRGGEGHAGPLERPKRDAGRKGPARDPRDGDEVRDHGDEEHSEKGEDDGLSRRAGSPRTPPDDDRNGVVALQSNTSRLLKSVLGEGRIDPFDALPVQGVPLFIHQVLDHVRTILPSAPFLRLAG
ncbi:uncharacterized protein A1O5_06653 [Cladophialophora psammophila CBS 110553]|uniref:Uncharacterized protein n=1 Tax=Cladophialophora psammophila CBS 110553 TaxID=1182543 RepID=W9WRM7_9EURO|nr:uncharacterized protein A1O5_06653 [Cladophialophora psammophila CBS 110553]EXJ70583.1 hypothetical protein A1O5_06653 [Cladophialophora psammophila CBS 110553]